MENRGKRQAASIFGGMGFYIALLVCVIAAGVVGYVALMSDGKDEVAPAVEDSLESMEQMEPVVAEQTAPVEPVISDTPVVIRQEAQETEEIASVTVEAAVELPETAPVLAVSEEAEKPVEEETLTVVSPILGETVAVFAADELVYDATLGDWRTHNGVDIEAPAGTAVSAAAAGAVLSVEEDSRMGTTITIQHSGGYVTTYASLQPEVQVALGDSVSAGTVIGTVGNTSLTEAGLGAHLHFSVSRDGEAVDPEEFLNAQ